MQHVMSSNQENSGNKKAWKKRLPLLGAFLGNIFEHYDTALYTLLAPFIAPLFFPGQDPVMALILTYAIIPIGMIARPFGSLFFGYIGDTYGRTIALQISLLGLAIVSGLIGFMPTYAEVGFFAPALLSFSRVLQNFFVSAETMGGAIFLMEQSDEKKHDMISSWFGASTIAGILMASGAVSLMCLFGNVEKQWRILYWLGTSTALCGWFLRREWTEPKFRPQASAESMFTLIFSYMKAFWTYRRPVFLIALAAGFSYANYTVALVMINGFAPLVSQVSKEDALQLNTMLLVFDFLLLPFFGMLATRYSRERMMELSALASLLIGIPLFSMLSGANLIEVLAIRMCLVVLGVWFAATLHSWAQPMVPAEHRYKILSVGYALGSQLIGGPTASLSLWMYRETQFVSSAAWYWVGLAAIFLIAMRLLPQKSYAVSQQAA